MLPAFRRLNLRPELPSRASPIHRFIHNSLCASRPLPFQSGATALEIAPASELSHDIANALRPDSDNPTKDQAISLSDQKASSKNIPPDVGPSTMKAAVPAKTRKTTEQRGTLVSTTPTRPVKPKKTPRKLIEPPTKKIEAFLQRVETEKDTLTLADVERYSPPTIPDTRSPEYEKEYNEVMNNLTRSFNMLNMQKIFDLYNLPQLPLSRQKKVSYAQAILEHWGWTPIAVVRDSVLDETKTSELRFLLRSEEAFLLMGKDGAELLSLAKRYAVNLSFYDPPMTLKANGLQGSLKRLEGYLKGFKKDIQSEVTSLPLGQSLSFETMKSISRLSGAYLAPEKDKFRIFFHKNQPWTSKIAQYLAVQVASGQPASMTQAVYSPNLAISGGTENLSSIYSLYPFSPHQHISWKISSSNTFRLRRVGQWLDPMNYANDFISIDENFDNAVLFDKPNTDLKSQLLGKLAMSRNSQFSLAISACTGHCLFLSSPSQTQTLVPPLIGRLDRSDILRWTREFPEGITFQPSVPISILASPADGEQHVRKLVYVEQTKARNQPNSGRTFIVEIPQISTDDKEKPELKPLCYIDKEVKVNVLIPDRFTDIQFSAAVVEEIPLSQVPAEFLSCTARLESGSDINQSIRSPDSQELAPFEVKFDGTTYALNSDTYVHREFKKMLVKDIKTSILVETHIDAGIGQSGTICKILCQDSSTEAGWRDFLRQCSSLAAES